MLVFAYESVAVVKAVHCFAVIEHWARNLNNGKKQKKYNCNAWAHRCIG